MDLAPWELQGLKYIKNNGEKNVNGNYLTTTVGISSAGDFLFK